MKKMLLAGILLLISVAGRAQKIDWKDERRKDGQAATVLFILSGAFGLGAALEYNSKTPDKPMVKSLTLISGGFFIVGCFPLIRREFYSIQGNGNGISLKIKI